jgi:hypothetical protein
MYQLTIDYTVTIDDEPYRGLYRTLYASYDSAVAALEAWTDEDWEDERIAEFGGPVTIHAADIT